MFSLERLSETQVRLTTTQILAAEMRFVSVNRFDPDTPRHVMAEEYLAILRTLKRPDTVYATFSSKSTSVDLNLVGLRDYVNIRGCISVPETYAELKQHILEAYPDISESCPSGPALSVFAMLFPAGESMIGYYGVVVEEFFRSTKSLFRRREHKMYRVRIAEEIWATCDQRLAVKAL